MPIYNCHLHIFTIDHVPKKFLPFGLTTLMKSTYLRKPLTFLLDNVIPFSKRDLLHRYSNFVRLSYQKKQRDIFETVRSYYPLDTRFIILPMDMSKMGAGEVPCSIEEQHEELAELRMIYPKNIIPFAAIDPRQDNPLEMLKDLIENKDFKGVKLYPPLGYLPSDEKLYPIYAYAEKKSIPAMVHCSRGGVRHTKLSAEETRSYADPDHYRSILKDFPKLRIS